MERERFIEAVFRMRDGSSSRYYMKFDAWVRVEQKIVDAPATMSVITAETMETSPAVNIGDTLRSVPGVNVIQTGARDYGMLALYDLDWTWVASHSGGGTPGSHEVDPRLRLETARRDAEGLEREGFGATVG